MSDDDRLPKRYTPPKADAVRYEKPEPAAQPSGLQLPKRNFLGAKVQEAASKASLELERTERLRAENAVAYLDVMTEAERAKFRFETVGRDNALYDAQRETAIVQEKEERIRASNSAEAKVSELQAIKAQNDAAREEALDRASEARIRREQREAKAAGADTGNIQERLDARRDRQRECLVKLSELDEEILALKQAAGEGDPVAAAKIRGLCAEQVIIHDEIDLIKNEIRQLSAEQ